MKEMENENILCVEELIENKDQNQRAKDLNCRFPIFLVHLLLLYDSGQIEE